ncbi:acyltransferase family protein [Glaciihabitans sp. dw_435]|uniref:acyltransferase family protein n=1 Tax=Glaciihabitans sp. dw_435 TaxID=2720081 RepID=UPI001BD60B5E|nr:acyltransferase family protein [Glaciihabitans sp. dw_435]
MAVVLTFPARSPDAHADAESVSAAPDKGDRIEPQAPVREPHSRLTGIDGLRAIAVIAVVVFHLFPAVMPGGALGVDIFFVISGFLITRLLLREHAATGRVRLAAFWTRRARRLLPALAALVLVCTLAAAVIGGDVMVGIGTQVLSAATFSSNWVAIATGSDYFAGTSPDLFRNLWSLAVEEQFYLFWPLILLLLLRSRRGIVGRVLVAAAVASAVLMLVLYNVGAGATRVYYGTDTHLFGLALGGLLAWGAVRFAGRGLVRWAWSRQLLMGAGCLALIALVTLTVVLPAQSPIAFRGGLVVACLLTVGVLVGAALPGSWLGRALDVPLLRWIGERSYGLYLWHWPVLVLVRAAMPAWRGSVFADVVVGLLTLVVTVGLATVSYRYLETPVRREGFRASIAAAFTRGPRRRLRSVTGAAVILVVATTTVLAGSAVVHAPTASASQELIEAGAAAVRSAGQQPDAGAGDVGPSIPHLPGRPPSSIAQPWGDGITAIGDSVMLASAPVLETTFPGISIDAVVSRQMRQLPSIVRSMISEGTLRPVLLVGLGTNGAIGRDTLDEVHAMLGPGHTMIVVNVQAPRGWTAGVNQTLTGFDRDNSDVELVDWKSAIAPHLGLLGADHIHPGHSGGLIYAAAIREALDRLNGQ